MSPDSIGVRCKLTRYFEWFAQFPSIRERLFTRHRCILVDAFTDAAQITNETKITVCSLRIINLTDMPYDSVTYQAGAYTRPLLSSS